MDIIRVASFFALPCEIKLWSITAIQTNSPSFHFELFQL